MTVGSLLFVFGGLTVALYFVLFYRTFATLDRTEWQRFTATFATGKERLVDVGLLGGMFLVPNVTLAVTLAVVAFGWIAWASLLQHSKMREMAFDPAFERRLFRISFLVPIGVGCLFASKLWYHAQSVS
jgi:hypothetical protein